MKEKQYLCMVELYFEDGNLFADYAHNTGDLVAEFVALEHLAGFVEVRKKEIHEEMKKRLEGEKS